MTLQAASIAVQLGGRTIVSDITLSVSPGQTVGLAGPSGSGKTSVARALAGLNPVSQGHVTVDGNPVETRRGAMDGRVVMLFQSPRRSCSPTIRLCDIIAEPLAGPAQGDQVAELAREVGLGEELLDRFPGQVSEGQLQRAALARCLAAEPSYLLCDEAMAMLDAVSTAALVAVIRRRTAQGLGVLAVSHDLQLLEAWADETWRLDASGLSRVI